MRQEPGARNCEHTQPDRAGALLTAAQYHALAGMSGDRVGALQLYSRRARLGNQGQAAKVHDLRAVQDALR